MMNTDEKKLDDIVAGINYMDSDFTTEAWRAVAKTAIREGHESEINAAYENALYDHASPKIPTFDEYIASDAGKKCAKRRVVDRMDWAIRRVMMHKKTVI